MEILKRSTVLLGMLVIISCGEKENKDLDKAYSPAETVVDNTDIDREKPKPRVQWKVNKEMDEDGNIISYDSTYTWSYTDTNGLAQERDMDSIMRSYYKYVAEAFSAPIHSNLDGIFDRDSAFYTKFLKDDELRSYWEKDFFEMQEAMARLDSLRYEFYKKNYLKTY